MSWELWRLLSCHLTHITWRQFSADAPAFVLLYVLFARRFGLAAALSLTLFSALGVSLAVILTGIHQLYGGLSGLSCSALSAIIIALIMDHPRRPIPWLITISFFEYLIFGEAIASDVKVAVEAHLAGAVSGVLFILTWQASKLSGQE